jgi:hypothetical protein
VADFDSVMNDWDPEENTREVRRRFLAIGFLLTSRIYFFFATIHDD